MVKAKGARWTGVVTNLTIVFISLSSLFATVSWIGSSKASGPAGDYRTEALSITIFWLGSSTEASTALLRAETYWTQAMVYYEYAGKENDENIKRYLENIVDTLLEKSNFYISVAENADNKAQAYSENFSDRLDTAKNLGNVADHRSTAALIFTAAAIVGSSGTLLKRREVIFLAIPIFVIAWYFLISSFFM